MSIFVAVAGTQNASVAIRLNLKKWCQCLSPGSTARQSSEVELDCLTVEPGLHSVPTLFRKSI